MQTIKQLVFTGWHPMRWLRLAIGIFAIVEAIRTHDTLIGILAGFLILTALTNIGCCGASCALPQNRNGGEEDKPGTDDIDVKK